MACTGILQYSRPVVDKVCVCLTNPESLNDAGCLATGSGLIADQGCAPAAARKYFWNHIADFIYATVHNIVVAIGCTWTTGAGTNTIDRRRSRTAISTLGLPVTQVASAGRVRWWHIGALVGDFAAPDIGGGDVHHLVWIRIHFTYIGFPAGEVTRFEIGVVAIISRALRCPSELILA